MSAAATLEAEWMTALEALTVREVDDQLRTIWSRASAECRVLLRRAVVKPQSQLPGRTPMPRMGYHYLPVHCAAWYGRLASLKVLLEDCGFNVDQRDLDSCTPLLMAAQYDKIEVVKYLVHTMHADCTLTDGSRRTPFFCAAAQGLLEIAQLLAAVAPSTVHVPNLSRQTPAFIAAAHGWLAMLQYLVREHSVDLSTVSFSGETALLAAAGAGRLEIVKYLVTECHCDPSTCNSYGQTPLMVAAKHGHVEVVRCLVVEGGANADAVDMTHRTALHHAALEGNLADVQLLTELGATVDLPSRSGFTALYLAADAGHEDVVRFLVGKCGASAEIVATGGTSALLAAAQRQHGAIVQYLANHGANVHVLSHDQSTPLHHACRTPDRELARFLIAEHHVSVDVANSENYTPLYLAAQAGDTDLVRMLVEEYGADIHRLQGTDEESPETALLIAARRGHLDLVQFLVAKGASISACAPDGPSAIFLAGSGGHMDVVRYLITCCGAELPIELWRLCANHLFDQAPIAASLLTHDVWEGKPPLGLFGYGIDESDEYRLRFDARTRSGNVIREIACVSSNDAFFSIEPTVTRVMMVAAAKAEAPVVFDLMQAHLLAQVPEFAEQRTLGAAAPRFFGRICDELITAFVRGVEEEDD